MLSTVIRACRRETLDELSHTEDRGRARRGSRASFKPKVLSPQTSQQRVTAAAAAAADSAKVATKGIANPVDRADETWPLRLIPQGLADLPISTFKLPSTTNVWARAVGGCPPCRGPSALPRPGSTAGRTLWAAGGIPSGRAAAGACLDRWRTGRKGLSPNRSKPNKSLRISLGLGSPPRSIVLDMHTSATRSLQPAGASRNPCGFRLQAEESATRNTAPTAAYVKPSCPDCSRTR